MLSAYLDSALTGREMQRLDEHLRRCSDCTGEYEALRSTQSLLANVRSVRVPRDLSLKLRLAISHEVARSRHAYFEVLMLHFENALRAFMVPATTGIVATILIFGLVAGILAAPPSVHANAADVPLMFATGPELQPNSFGFSMGPVDEDSLLIEAYVDANGSVEDYRILSGSQDPKDVHELRRVLIMTRFRPATWMGTPRPGTAILSFSKISVKG
jgi:hypothetical protein